jgi:hypothetical protein
MVAKGSNWEICVSPPSLVQLSQAGLARYDLSFSSKANKVYG